jgi:hypothetical protein
MATEADTLKTIRDGYRVDSEAWEDIRTEGDKDMLCVAGDVWGAMDPTGKQARIDAKRPVLSPDELSQYINQAINDARANKRSIKVTAIGFGATEDTAKYRQDRIRQIEYRSNAQMAYMGGYSDAIQRGYGFWRVVAEYVNPEESPDQELLIKPCWNPNLVTPDANSVRPDLSDMQRCTIREIRRWDDLKRQFPEAKLGDFSAHLYDECPDWIVKDDSVILAEHWLIAASKRSRVAWQGRDGQAESGWEDELGKRLPKDNFRKWQASVNRVKSYVTNGIAILEENDWPGKWIPIVGCLGKVLYINQGGQTRRILLGLVRLARDAAMYHAYVRTCAAEAIGGVPRATYVAYEGQLAGHETDWQRANKEPVPYLEARPFTEEYSSGTPLPLPQKQSWDPPIQNLEFATESARRSIQAAIGSMPLPTMAQRQNEKSGVALKQIQAQTQRGNFHFLDNLELAMCRTGEILCDLLPHYDDTAREVTVRRGDGTPALVRVNDPNDPKSVQTNLGLHDVTVSTGPQADSEREAASDFADLLMGSEAMAPVVADLAVRLKDLGPIGDQIAERLHAMLPPQVQALEQAKQQGQQNPEQMAQENAQLKAQMAQAQQMLQQAMGEAQSGIEKAKIQAEASLQIEQMKAQAQTQLQLQLQQMKDATSIRVAEIQAGVKLDTGQTSAEMEALALDVEVQENERDREHEMAMAGVQHEMALEQGEQAVAGQMVQQGQKHRQAIEQGERGHQQKLQQGQQAVQGQIQAIKAKPQPKPAGTKK